MATLPAWRLRKALGYKTMWREPRLVRGYGEEREGHRVLPDTRGSPDPIEEVEARIADGRMSREAVERARVLWREQLPNGVVMPNGERAIISEQDLHHILLVDRILRKPERIERLLRNVLELRTARWGRRIGLSQWGEDTETVYGFVILEGDSYVRTMHIIDARGIRKRSRKGVQLWKRGQ